MEPLEVARFDEEGLEEDRHRHPASPNQVLVHDHEVNEELGLSAGTVKENVTVSGVAVNGLPFGTRLVLGNVVLELTKECAPCSRMDGIRAGLRSELEGRRGVYARVHTPGVVRVGDTVTVQQMEVAG